jgi:hypothetical protein
MSNINDWIRIAEQKWLQIFYLFCRNLFRNVYLPSHNHDHHLRVWHFSRELLRNLYVYNFKVTYESVEGLMIAAFFHDTGMSVTKGEKHGKESRRICRDFFHDNKIPPPSSFTEILDAIENHDKKEYGRISVRMNRRQDLPIITLLNISDDLDAFGYTGIYRYAEIYLLRKIPVKRLPGEVLNNLAARFEHINISITELKDFLTHHFKRYEITREFFLLLEQQLRNGIMDELTGPFQVIRVIQEKITGNRKHPSNVIRDIDKYTGDEYTRTFFRHLMEEEDIYKDLFKDPGLYK